MVKICTTCGTILEEEDYVCPSGYTHRVFTIEEVSDIVNAYYADKKIEMSEEDMMECNFYD